MRIDLSAIDLGDTAGFASRMAATADVNSDGVAMECDDQRLTWSALFMRACRVANGLAESGCRPGDRVAILAANSTEYFECFMGIVSFGMCAVTIPTMVDPGGVAAILNDSDTKALFASAREADKAASAVEQADHLIEESCIAYDFAAPGWLDYASWLATARATPPTITVSPEAEFNIVYSSGTTGTPKGIVHSHGTRASMSQGFGALGFDQQAVTMLASPFYTNMSIPAFLATLWGGGSTLAVSKFDARRYLELAEQRRATHFFIVPSMAQRLLDEPTFDRRDLSATRLKYIGASLVPPDLKRALWERWPGALLEVYGMTEGAPVTCFHPKDHPDKISSVGQPVAGSEIRILDEEGHELPIGSTGEIAGRSGSMMLGYNNLPEETERVIWRDAEGRVFFRSGDIGRFDEDGFLYILDRKKDMIISGGLNIYAADLEPVIAQHPDVAEVAVIAIPSERWGETPLALVVTKANARATEEEILAWANARLGKHQRLAAVELRAELPRNALRKVMKRELRAPYWKATDPARREPNAASDGILEGGG
jgi:acyl-CoA synthetase (AMP-forming)/AMP-acid ligase II